MTEYIGKLIPGLFATFCGFFGLAKVSEPSVEFTMICGFFAIWGISTWYPELLNAIDDLHMYAGTMVGADVK